MERTAQRNVTIVGTTLPVGYRMENVMIMGVLALDTSLHFVKVNQYLKTLCFSPFRDIYNLHQGKGTYVHNYIDTRYALNLQQNIDFQFISDTDIS